MGHDFAYKNFPAAWELTTLGEIVKQSGGSIQTGPFGSQLHASDYVSNGIPSVMPKNITIEGISENDIARITDEDAKRLSKYLLDEGDIVYSRRGDVEKCALVKAHERGWLCGTGCLRIRLGKNTNLTSDFLHAYLSTPAIREWVSRNAIGATMPNLNTSILSDIPVVIPNEEEIILFGNIWHNLNQKITLNRQINQTLEQMAQTLFKSWFVDFDPVIDNALDAGNDIPDTLQDRAEQRRLLRAKADFKPLPAETRALFPSEFEETELGWVPKGWMLASLGDVSNCFDSKRIPLSKQERELKQPGSIPYYGATSEMDLINEWIFDDIYLLMGEDGSVMKEDGTPFLQYIWGKSWVNNHAHVLQGKADISTEHLLVFLQQCDIKAFVTGAVQLKINQKNMNSISFVKAIESINLAFQKVICPLFDRRRQIEDESRILRKLRDSLLPKLISGELALDALPEMPELAETR